MTFRTLAIGAALACIVLPRLAWGADAQADAQPRAPIVVQYDAPPECPGTSAFAASVRAELAGRKWDASQPLQVRVRIRAAAADGEQGYTATVASSNAGPIGLERTLTAKTCGEVTEMASAIIALAQAEEATPIVVVPTRADETKPSAAEPPAQSWEYSVTLGYGAFTTGPAEPVVYGFGEQTSFNPAQGVRLGFGVTQRLGTWARSLHVSVAYYRQSTSTIATVVTPSPSNVTPAPSDVSIADRDVLLGTLDACPVHIEYEFLSLIPCGTFSMIESQGTSGRSPGLETGLGGSGRLRAKLDRFFLEGMGAAVGVLSSYEPPSQHVRVFYSLSLGMAFR